MEAAAKDLATASSLLSMGFSMGREENLDELRLHQLQVHKERDRAADATESSMCVVAVCRGALDTVASIPNREIGAPSKKFGAARKATQTSQKTSDASNDAAPFLL